VEAQTGWKKAGLVGAILLSLLAIIACTWKLARMTTPKGGP
jgi:uncharacterized membrane protein YqjE